MAKIIKELKGHSGSSVFIMKNDDNTVYVQKIGNVLRNLERINSLTRLGLEFPQIYHSDSDSYSMAYVHNIDIKTFLSMNGIDVLVDYIKNIIDTLKLQFEYKDYTEIYHKKLSSLNFTEYKLNFSSDELISKLPKILPCTEYHGDFTLENILFNLKTSKFILIDPITTEYDSFVFDLAKLRQDLVCGWFVRHAPTLNIQTKLNAINYKLSQYTHYENNNLLILMLLRILPYSKEEKDINFLVERINELWK